MAESKRAGMAGREMEENGRTKVTIGPGGQDLIVTQMYDAPREKVFRLYVDPKQIPNWWGPRRLKSTVERMDAMPGGSWRIIQRDAQGNDYGFHGVFHGVKAPEMIVRTFEFEGMPGHVSLETTTFEERAGKTIARTLQVFQTSEDRDGMMSTGAEEGATESGERFAELLEKM